MSGARGYDRLNAGVKKIVTEGKNIKGLCLENGETVKADEYVINGDFGHIMTNVVEPGVLKKYSAAKFRKSLYHVQRLCFIKFRARF